MRIIEYYPWPEPPHFSPQWNLFAYLIEYKIKVPVTEFLIHVPYKMLTISIRTLEEIRRLIISDKYMQLASI